MQQEREFKAEAKGFYEQVLPYALRVQEGNPSIESLALLVGDTYYGLERYPEAIAQFRRGVQMVPFFGELRLGLALVYKESGDWRGAAEQLVESCRRVTCQADSWDLEARDSLLPVPTIPREKMLIEVAENAQGRGALVQAFAREIGKNPTNPNLPTFLSMVHYFTKNRPEAVRWMRQAERLGMSGSEGREHTLATYISIREDW